jgi:hypothetical protein
LSLFVSILRGFNDLESLEGLLPDNRESPMALLHAGNKSAKKRASSRVYADVKIGSQHVISESKSTFSRAGVSAKSIINAVAKKGKAKV